MSRQYVFASSRLLAKKKKKKKKGGVGVWDLFLRPRYPRAGSSRGEIRGRDRPTENLATSCLVIVAVFQRDTRSHIAQRPGFLANHSLCSHSCDQKQETTFSHSAPGDSVSREGMSCVHARCKEVRHLYVINSILPWTGV